MRTHRKEKKGEIRMCINPTQLIVEGEAVEVWCRYCWQCQKNRVNDLVGRCIAEQKTASQTLAVTLTYDDAELVKDGREANAAVLVYADFQRFMKRLRKAGFNVRYIVAGEYGSKKGRAHWHAVLFFYGKTLKIVEEPAQRGKWDVLLPRWKHDPWARINWEPWKDGFAYFQEAEYEGFQYLMKYALKDQQAEVAETTLSMSKKPPLGAAFFKEEAERHVAAHLAPRSAHYSFRDVRGKDGKPRKFYLRGRMQEIYLESFVVEWEKRNGKVPNNDFVQKHWERLDREAEEYQSVRWAV